MRIAGTSPVSRGDRIGGYLLGDLIGTGGMGSVYEARCADDLVAVKVLHRELLGDTHAMRRFRDEADAGTIVTHANLAGVIDRGVTADGVPYLVMRRIRGEVLGQLLAREELSLQRAVKLVLQLLAGLAALHGAGIVHGDVKSDNVLVDRGDVGDVVTLIDFGLARVQLTNTEVESVREDELISGTPEYMAPEVIAGQLPTRAADIYGAGVILYELVVGTTPFGGGSADAIIQRQLDDDVVPPSLRAHRTVPPILDRVILRALDKDPARRYASADRFATALGIALPCLTDVASPLVDSTFAQDAPTLDWHVSERPRSAHRPSRGRNSRGSAGRSRSDGGEAERGRRRDPRAS